jgi:hypothetical protein
MEPGHRNTWALGNAKGPSVHLFHIDGELKSSQAWRCRSATFAKAIVNAAPPSVFTSVVCWA